MVSRLLVPVLLIALLSGSSVAQLAKFTSYGAACPTAQQALSLSGLPKLGTSFTISGIRFPSRCTLRFCSCACCDCNDCSGSVLFLGIGRIQVKLPGGCDLLVTPDFPLVGNTSGVVTLSVPNQPVLMNQKFYLQRVDFALKEVTGTQCKTTYRPLSFTGLSNGMEGTIGL